MVLSGVHSGSKAQDKGAPEARNHGLKDPAIYVVLWVFRARKVLVFDLFVRVVSQAMGQSQNGTSRSFKSHALVIRKV